MFLGHYGVAFALKRAEPRVSLGTLFFATVLLDILWGAFLLTGWEQARIAPGLTPVTPIEFIRYPISHSLLAAFLWAGLAATIMYSWPTRDTSRHHWLKAAVVGIAVLSHWFLDLLVHLPDLPLASDQSSKLGFGLWRSLPATLVLEFLVIGIGLGIYLIWRRAKGPVPLGRILIVAGLLVLLYLTSLFGPTPSSMKIIGVVDIAGTLFLAALAAWADRGAMVRAKS